MKKRLAMLATASILTVFVMAGAAVPAMGAITINYSLTASNVDPGDALLVAAAGLFFGLDTNLTVNYRSSIGSPTATISLFYLAAEAQTTPDQYIIAKKQGRGWGALAKGKMPPGLAGKWKSGDPFSLNDTDFETGVTINFLSTYYGISQDQIILWVKQGASVTDIGLCLNLAAKVKVPAATIISARIKGASWVQLGATYKITLEQMKQPVAPKVKHNKKVPTPGNKGDKNNKK